MTVLLLVVPNTVDFRFYFLRVEHNKNIPTLPCFPPLGSDIRSESRIVAPDILTITFIFHHSRVRRAPVPLNVFFLIFSVGKISFNCQQAAVIRYKQKHYKLTDCKTYKFLLLFKVGTCVLMIFSYM